MTLYEINIEHNENFKYVICDKCLKRIKNDLCLHCGRSDRHNNGDYFDVCLKCSYKIIDKQHSKHGR